MRLGSSVAHIAVDSGRPDRRPFDSGEAEMAGLARIEEDRR
jgi:hypothetical protein